MTGIEACGLFVAEDRDAAIGVATVSLEFGIEYGWSAEMGDLYVVPEWRGRGLSGAIIAEIEAFLKARGARGCIRPPYCRSAGSCPATPRLEGADVLWA
jgi:GNAT superfamily N-acetyltransferase